MDDFSGFPKELFTFLDQIAANNNREWFKDNKERYYDVVVDPVCDFIEAMEPRLHVISSHFVAGSRPYGGSMFRIYRDTHFSKDKRPYKENVGCHFRHEAGGDAHAPCFYVHLGRDEVFYGGGLWLPSNAALSLVRDAIVEHPGQWLGITTSLTFVNHFGGIDGDSLQRSPRGYDPEHPHIEDLKRKSLFARRTATKEQAMSPQFADDIASTFFAMSPFMEFLTRAVKLPY
jgi:uncharacterized protein (TIGR02453 family)